MEHNIDIDMNKKCKKCGRDGATVSGLCLICIEERIVRGAGTDEIVLDCKLESVKTDWPKNEIRISFAATQRQAEYEAVRLGEIARLEHPCFVRIHRTDEPVTLALKLPCHIEAVRTDHKQAKVIVTVSTGSTQENVGKCVSLGVLASMSVPTTARFESRQPGFKFDNLAADSDGGDDGEE
jgi:hypothetical protein